MIFLYCNIHVELQIKYCLNKSVYIVKTKYQSAESKAVVGVDRPYGTIYAYTKAILGKTCLCSHS